MKIKLGAQQRDVTGECGVFAVPAAALTLTPPEYIFLAPVVVEVQCRHDADVFTVSGTISYRLQLSCSRCLEPFTLQHRFPWSEEFRRVTAGVSEGNVVYDDDSGVWNFTGESIDLTEAVRENIIMSLPLKAVCRENCQGLCPHCGINLNKHRCQCSPDNSDPRFAVLRQWLSEHARRDTTKA